MARVFISIGSNVSAERNVRKALEMLAREVRITGMSTFYRTEAFGRPDLPPFINGVVQIETGSSPRELKESVLEPIEDGLDRVRTADKNAPRTIDLDVILYGEKPADPDIKERRFLAIPLCELAPDLAVPGTDMRVCEIARSMGDGGMEPLAEYTERLRKDVLSGC